MKSAFKFPGAVLAMVLIATAISSVGFSGLTAASHNSDKPIVVLLHGLGRNSSSMWLMAKRLDEAGFKVHRIEYESLDTSPADIVEVVAEDIDQCCADVSTDVHFVGHSLGGLVIRTYLAERLPRNLGRVVLVGTPNAGTALVDKFRDWEVFDLLGPTTASLGTDSESLPAKLPAPYYPVGVIAGIRDSNWNDRWLPGPDDGLVAVESTKLEGMTDFIVIETGHSMMRYSEEVADQIVNFLKHGKFYHATVE